MAILQCSGYVLICLLQAMELLQDKLLVYIFAHSQKILMSENLNSCTNENLNFRTYFSYISCRM